MGTAEPFRGVSHPGALIQSPVADALDSASTHTSTSAGLCHPRDERDEPTEARTLRKHSIGTESGRKGGVGTAASQPLVLRSGRPGATAEDRTPRRAGRPRRSSQADAARGDGRHLRRDPRAE